MQIFKFSEELAEQVRDALIDRIADAMQNDKECARSIAEHGHPGVSDLDGNELMDEYMNWHGAFSIEENPDDLLLARMFDEHSTFELEKEVLDDGNNIQIET
jgi:hypothetical protein